MARFKPVLKFQSYTNQALNDYAKGITLAMTGSLTFSSPPVTLSDQGTINDGYQASILAWGPNGNHGSKADHQTMLDMRAATKEMIRSLSDYVDGIAAGDLSLIMSAGMVANQVKNPLGILPAPLGFRSPYSKHTLPGQTRLRWGKVKGAVAYEIYTAATPTDPFLLLGTSTKTLFIGTSAPGRLAYYTVRAVGTAGLGLETSPLSAHSSL